MTYEEADKYCIFKYISGSHAYGFNVPDSDEDIRGVFMAPLPHFFNVFSSEDGVDVHTVHKSGADDEMHELRKLLRLAAECNPNILEFLYVNRLIKYETAVWTEIVRHRDLFLSKKARFTFSGYAIAQLKRIKSHRGYLLNPPTKKPERSDYGLPVDSKMPRSVQRTILSMDDTWFSDSTRDLAIKEREYAIAMNHYKSYEEWHKNRNPARKGMEDRCGYDLKHATHLVRLISMCREILTEGTLTVYRPDRKLLLDIRQGAWSYDKLEAYAIDSDQELSVLYAMSDLQDKPDRKRIQELYNELYQVK